MSANPVGNGSRIPHFSVDALLDSFEKEMDPNELPKPVYEKTEVSSIARHIADQEAAKNLVEFNRVRDVMKKVIAPTIMLCHAFGKDNSSIVHVAIERQDLPMLKLSIFFARNLINHKTEDGLSPICLAAVTGQTEMVEWLADPSALGIKEKADIHDRTPDGQTLLHKALMFGHAQTAAKLVLLGASKDAVDGYDMTPADWACFKLHSFDRQTNVAVKDDPLQAQKYTLLMKEYAPARGVCSIDQIAIKLGFKET